MPSVPLYQFATNVESQPCPADPPLLSVASPHEAPEYLRMLLLRNPDAGIVHTDTYFLSCYLFPDTDGYRPSLRAVFYGIANQVDQHLLNASRVNIC